MNPSQDALDIDEAHKAFVVARGTPYETQAKAALDAVVARVKAKYTRSR